MAVAKHAKQGLVLGSMVIDGQKHADISYRVSTPRGDIRTVNNNQPIVCVAADLPSVTVGAHV
jgi:hypothetical protein